LSELDYYLDLLGKILRAINSMPVFQQFPLEIRVELAKAVMSEMAKDRRMAQIKPTKPVTKPVRLATEKQKQLMRKLGISFKPGITVEEASKLISAKLGD